MIKRPSALSGMTAMLCAGVAVLMRGLLEVSGVNEALRSPDGNEPDPRFVAFMAEQQQLAEERMAARRLEGESSRPGALQNRHASTDGLR